MAPPKRSTSATGSDEVRQPSKRAISEASVLNSPLKRVKAAIQQRVSARVAREELVLPTVEEYRSHVLTEMNQPINPDIDVIVTGTLIWKSAHTYGERNFVRLHITDTEPEESLEELAEFKQLHRSSDENRIIVDGALLTATIFGEPLDSPNLPDDGSVIRITNSRKRFVYDGKNCQLVAKAADITVITSP